MVHDAISFSKFQHTAARRRLAPKISNTKQHVRFQHTAARRRLEALAKAIKKAMDVSTHSRPKAAGQ